MTQHHQNGFCTLKVPLRPSLVFSFPWRTGAPPVELDARIGTDANVREGTEKLAVLLALTVLFEAAVRASCRFPAFQPVTSVFLFLPQLLHQRQRALGRHVEFQLALEVVELLHEVEIGCYVGFSRADDVEGVVEV